MEDRRKQTKGWWLDMFEKAGEALGLRTRRGCLPSLNDVLEITRVEGNQYLSVQTIEVDKIIGSEGRYADFEKNFLPINSNLNQRLDSIREMYRTGQVLPPISVYKINDYYFVRDGNHRVSVAKSAGQKYIDADVLELKINVPITKELSVRDLILIEENSRFVEVTGIGSGKSHENIRLTSPGMYSELLDIIKEYNRLFKIGEEGADLKRIAEQWYRKVFLPFAEDAFNNDLLSKFPGRTTGDLYIWAQVHWNEIVKHTDSFDYVPEGNDWHGPEGTERHFSAKELKLLSSAFSSPKIKEVNVFRERTIGLTICCVLFHIDAEERLHLVLVRRKYHPCEREWTLPISKLRINERISSAAERCQMNVLGLKQPVPMCSFCTKDDIDRHPFGRSIALGMLGFLHDKTSEMELKPGHLASEVLLADLSNLPKLVYDHNEIVMDALNFLASHQNELRTIAPLFPSELPLKKLLNILGTIKNEVAYLKRR